jgi:protein TonB
MQSDTGYTHGCRSGPENRIYHSFIFSLSILSICFFTWPKFDLNIRKLHSVDQFPIILEEIPLAKPPDRLPEPVRPIIPIPSDEDELPDPAEISMIETIGQWTPGQDFPEPQGGIPEIVDFVLVAEKPTVIKKVTPQYPPLAKAAGIEGLVVVKVLIDTHGDVEKAEVIKSIPMLDDAALSAGLEFKFKPGKQREKLVRVWMSIPFQFHLK